MVTVLQHLSCHIKPASEHEGVSVVLPRHVEVEQEVSTQLVAVQVLGEVWWQNGSEQFPLCCAGCQLGQVEGGGEGGAQGLQVAEHLG